MRPNRLAVERAASGAVVLDDTYNANPAGGQVALEALAGYRDGRRVVVTPGMVELGALQAGENTAFAARALEVADVLVVVGRTNRRALLDGATLAGKAPRGGDGAAGLPGVAGRDGACRRRVICVERRDDAVEWVRRELGAGDAVLYENDLPDHYP